jgi:murein DD-endopeptidase MepM/ murein hydrolase activator NlpD
MARWSGSGCLKSPRKRPIFVVGSGAALITGSFATLAIAAEPEVAKPRVVGVEWPDAGPISVSGNVGKRLEGVDQTLLPVLIPKPFLAYDDLAFVGDQLEYSASVQVKDKDGDNKIDAVLGITGTRIAIDADTDPSLDPSASVRSALRANAAEASVNRYGAAYQVTVECKRSNDKRCTNESYARNLLQSVELVGGGRDGAAPPPPQTPPLSTTIPVSSDPNFQADPAGLLQPDKSGSGVRSNTIYAPGIRFPVSVKPAYINSQVWGFGGSSNPSPNGWSDPRNYKYPWHDNFCEKRHWTTPMCPGGTGHQGVDIRPSQWKNQGGQKGVAVENGRIAYVGIFKVTLAGDSGIHYNYLHMKNVTVKKGDRVTAGQALGLISNNFGNSSTTYHLHFEIQQNRNGKGWVHVPPYSSLVAAYERM